MIPSVCFVIRRQKWCDQRDVVAMAQTLAARPWHAVDLARLESRCKANRLSAEQTEAALAASSGTAIAIIEGAPGAGKTTTLARVVEAYRDLRSSGAGDVKVIATATAWRIAAMLRDDLHIKSRATASWIAALKTGQQVLDSRTVLIADEAGLLSSREMHTLLGAVAKAGAARLGGRPPAAAAIGAGPGLSLVARAVEAGRVDTIVRQRELWAREAVTAFGAGRAGAALNAFASRGLVIETPGAKAAIAAIADAADRAHKQGPNSSFWFSPNQMPRLVRSRAKYANGAKLRD